MIVDASAIVAIVRGEPEADELLSCLESTSTAASMSAATYLETSIVVGPERHAELDALLHDAEISIASLDAEQARAARAAYVSFGRGSGSPAKLNFGDCFSYALAKVTGQPLLFKGVDFTHTDITAAVR